jgi:hypothetical protein
LPLTVSPESFSVRSFITVGAAQSSATQLRVAPETLTTAPGETDSSPLPASIVTVRALAPACACIVTLSAIVPIPGYGVAPLGATLITSPSTEQLTAFWMLANGAAAVTRSNRASIYERMFVRRLCESLQVSPMPNRTHRHGRP